MNTAARACLCSSFGPTERRAREISAPFTSVGFAAVGTCSIDEFKWGVADRGCSIRIPRDTHAALCGYLEDRRPASNVDPYRATAKLMATAMAKDDVSDAVAACMPLFAPGTVAPDGAAIEEAVAGATVSA